MTGVRLVEARWGVEFWQLVADFAEQGLNRFDTARALGYSPQGFCHLLSRHPKKDPFDPSSRALAYWKDTGENMRQALERMAKERRSWAYAARTIGYSDGHTLKKAAEHRGIFVEMNSKHPGRPRIHPIPEPRGDLTLNWPTWEKIYEIGGGPLPEFRRKKKCQTKFAKKFSKPCATVLTDLYGREGCQPRVSGSSFSTTPCCA